MEGDSSGNIESTSKTLSQLEHDDSSVFQSSWIRRNPVLAEDITGSLWYANLVMYATAASFFGLAILFRWLSRKKNKTSNK